VKYEKAFYKIYRITGVYKDPQLKIHPYLTNLFSNSLLFEAYRMPMVTPPLPWYSPAKGGYFLSKSNLLRLKPGLNEQRILIENTDPSNMYPIYDSLNTLSSCAWRINKRILDLIVSVFIKKGNKDLVRIFF
jgi:DNA-directed RNA polymerase